MAKETKHMVAMIVLLLTMINTQVWATDSLQVNLLQDTNHLLPDTNLLNLGEQPTIAQAERVSMCDILISENITIMAYICFVVILICGGILFIRNPRKEDLLVSNNDAGSKPTLYDRPMRVFSVFVMLFIAILVNNTWGYLAVMIIFATILTDLKFPLTLAALLTKDKNYFDYLSKSETEQKAQEKIDEDMEIEPIEPQTTPVEEEEVTEEEDKTEEVESMTSLSPKLRILQKPTFRQQGIVPPAQHDGNVEPPRDKTVPHHMPNNNNQNAALRKYMKIESLTFALLEKEHGKSIMQHVQMKGHMGIEFDGVLEHQRYNIVFEIRYNQNPELIDRTINRLIYEVMLYQRECGKIVEFHYICVVQNEEKRQKTSDYLRRIYHTTTTKINNINIVFRVLLEDEIVSKNQTIDYKTFMDTVDWAELNIEERMALFEAAHGNLNENGIPFSVQSINGDSENVVLSYIDSDTSLILTEKGKKDFPHWLEQTYMNGENGYSYLGFHQATEHDDE